MSEIDIIRVTREKVLATYPIRPPVGLSNRPSKPTRADRDEVLTLTSLYQKPFVTGVARAALLNLSVPKVSRLLAGMEAKKWIVALNFSRPTRGYLKSYDITEEGLRAAQLSPPDKGGGSCIHRLCVQHLHDLFEGEGLAPEIEYALNGKRADLGLKAGSGVIAVEVGISSAENEFSNIKKDYAAGFDEVRVLVRESKMIQRVKELMARDKYEAPPSLTVELLAEYLERKAVPQTGD